MKGLLNLTCVSNFPFPSSIMFHGSLRSLALALDDRTLAPRKLNPEASDFIQTRLSTAKSTALSTSISGASVSSVFPSPEPVWVLNRENPTLIQPSLVLNKKEYRDNDDNEQLLVRDLQGC